MLPRVKYIIPKFCVELGASIMLGLPIIVWLPDDRQLPPGLRRVAFRVLRGDLDSEFGKGELMRAIEDARAMLEAVRDA